MTRPKPAPVPPPSPTLEDNPDRTAHLAAGHRILKGTIYEFGSVFQVCACGAKVTTSGE